MHAYSRCDHDQVTSSRHAAVCPSTVRHCEHAPSQPVHLQMHARIACGRSGMVADRTAVWPVSSCGFHSSKPCSLSQTAEPAECDRSPRRWRCCCMVNQPWQQLTTCPINCLWLTCACWSISCSVTASCQHSWRQDECLLSRNRSPAHCSLVI